MKAKMLHDALSVDWNNLRRIFFKQKDDVIQLRIIQPLELKAVKFSSVEPKPSGNFRGIDL